MTLVAEAANGREAIQQFRVHRPDVMLMDIQMPEMNGLDALIAIRTEFPDDDLLVCLLTGTMGVALAMLGPGRWSLDARLFGWKRIEAHPGASRSNLL